MICRVFLFECADGPTNMAVDEALLRGVDQDPTSAALRTYGWSPPTLSLGYFQPFLRFANDPAWRGVPIVRRCSGGGAIWHEHQVTYALVLPRAIWGSRTSEWVYRAVHDHVISWIRERIPSNSAATAARAGFARALEHERPALCFDDRAADDVVIAGHKVLGSAQRRRPNALLQHGSLQLRASARLPALLGLADLGVGDGTVASALPCFNQLPEALGLEGVESELSNAEFALSAHLRQNRYDTREWLARR